MTRPAVANLSTSWTTCHGPQGLLSKKKGLGGQGNLTKLPFRSYVGLINRDASLLQTLRKCKSVVGLKKYKSIFIQRTFIKQLLCAGHMIVHWS